MKQPCCVAQWDFYLFFIFLNPCGFIVFTLVLVATLHLARRLTTTSWARDGTASTRTTWTNQPTAASRESQVAAATSDPGGAEGVTVHSSLPSRLSRERVQLAAPPPTSADLCSLSTALDGVPFGLHPKFDVQPDSTVRLSVSASENWPMFSWSDTFLSSVKVSHSKESEKCLPFPLLSSLTNGSFSLLWRRHLKKKKKRIFDRMVWKTFSCQLVTRTYFIFFFLKKIWDPLGLIAGGETPSHTPGPPCILHTAYMYFIYCLVEVKWSYKQTHNVTNCKIHHGNT